MFSLIITIISIALVAALAVATIYYGGDAFNQGSSKAKASTVINQAQQIAGANTLYKSDKGSFTDSLSALQTGKYLASVPTADVVATPGYTVSTANVVSATLVANTTEVCQKINDIANGTDTGAFNASAQFGCNAGAFTFKG